MEKKDKELILKSTRELKKWADEGSERSVLVIASDGKGIFVSAKCSSYLRMSEAIANAIHVEPELLAATKIGLAAAEEQNRHKKKNKE